LLISVIETPVPQCGDQRPVQTLDEWTSIYEGLSDLEVEEIDQSAKKRANLTRHFS
jgi:hypothetical protein